MKNFILKHAMALVALAIAASYGLMSFGSSDTSVGKTDELRWFTVEMGDSGYEYASSNPSGGTTAPEPGCESEDDAILCAVAFPESQIGTNGLPTPDPEQAAPANKRYKEEQ